MPKHMQLVHASDTRSCPCASHHAIDPAANLLAPSPPALPSNPFQPQAVDSIKRKGSCNPEEDEWGEVSDIPPAAAAGDGLQLPAQEVPR
jgi:hypothetical protein